MAAQAGFEPALPKHGLTVRCITYLPLSNKIYIKEQMVTVERFELPTHGLEIRCSIQAELHRHKMEPPVGIEPTT